MDQIQNKDPFFCMGLENEDSALPAFDDGSKSESSDFCIDISDAELTVDPAAEDRCVGVSSDSTNLVREPSAHANTAEISHNSNIQANEQTRDVPGGTELLADVWDNLTYDASIVSFECDQDSWKLENFDDEQFDCLMSQYVPAVRDDNASASTLMTAETHNNGCANSLCLSNTRMEELNKISGRNSGASKLGRGEFGAARTSGDKNLGTHQRLSTLPGAGGLETGMLATDLNSMREVGITFEEHNSVDGWIQHAGVNRNSVPGCLDGEIVMGTANCEHRQVTGSDDQDELSLREALLSEADSCLICDNATETNIMFCDEQCDCTGSGTDLTQNVKFDLDSNMTSDKENQSKNMADTTETNVVCGEQFESDSCADSGSDVIQNEKLKLNNNLACSKENQSKIVANTAETEAKLFCEEPSESGDCGVSNVIRNENFRRSIFNMIQSKNMAEATDHGATGIICCSSLPDWDKNDEILSCESDEKKTLDPVFQSILNSDSGSQSADALHTSELTSSGTARLKLDIVSKMSSQTAVTVDDKDSFIPTTGAAFSDNPQPVCSHPSDSPALAVGSKDLPKNCEPLPTELSNREEVPDSDTSGEEVLLLEYANQEGTGGDANNMPNVKMKKLSAETSKDEETLPSCNPTECCGHTPLSADVALSVTDSSEVPRCGSTIVHDGSEMPHSGSTIVHNGSEMPHCGSTIVHDKLPTDKGNSEMEDFVVSVMDETHEETSTEVESTSLALEDKDFLRTDKKDSFDEVHRDNEGGLASENMTADESELSIVHKSTKLDEFGSSDKNDKLTPKQGRGDNLINVDEREDSPPPTDGDIDSVVRSIKKEKPWTFGDEAPTEEVSWKDPVPHGLKECFCPHGIVSRQAGHFHCQECGLTSVYKNSILRHEVMKHRVKHTVVKIFQCRLCPSIFVHGTEFQRHSKKHAQNIIPSFKGEEPPSSDSETPPQLDSSVAPSSESSPKRGNSVPLPRCRRSSAGWNWKVAFDFQSLMEQRVKKRKSDQLTTEQESSADVSEKPDETLRIKRVKPNTKTDVGNEKPAEIGCYNVTEVSADGVQTTFKQPCYDGVLLASLIEPTITCPVCYRKFSQTIVQKKHYAQVHRIYLQGITLYQCIPCGFRCVSSSDFDGHVQRARHRIVCDSLKKPGCADTSAVAGCVSSIVADSRSSAVIGSRGLKSKRRRSNCVIGDDVKPSNKVRYNSDSNEKRSSLEVHSNREGLQGARRDEGNGSEKVDIEISRKRVKWFYGNATNDGGLSPEIPVNACVSNHVCTSACVCGLSTKDEMPSRTIHKKKKKKKVAVEERSDGIESASPSELFQPVIVDSFSCLPSMWTSISDIPSNENGTAADKASKNLQMEKKSCRTEPDKELLPSQFASNTTKAIKFFQNTQRTIFTASLQNTLKPQPTVPQVKPRSQVALKSTSQQIVRRSKDSTETITSRSRKTHSRDDSHDIDNTIIIHLSDDDDDDNYDSSNSATTAPLDLVGYKTEAAQPNSAAGCSNQVRSKTLDCGAFNSADFAPPVDTSICKRSENRRRVSTPSTSQAADAAPARKSTLSDFRSDVLCDELQKRGFMKRCVCGVFFLGLPTYNLHYAWHSAGSPLKCSVCNAVTKDWYEFYSHVQNHCK